MVEKAFTMLDRDGSGKLDIKDVSKKKSVEITFVFSQCL